MKERAVKWLSDAPVGSHAESDHSDDAGDSPSASPSPRGRDRKRSARKQKGSLHSHSTEQTEVSSFKSVANVQSVLGIFKARRVATIARKSKASASEMSVLLATSAQVEAMEAHLSAQRLQDEEAKKVELDKITKINKGKHGLCRMRLRLQNSKWMRAFMMLKLRSAFQLDQRDSKRRSDRDFHRMRQGLLSKYVTLQTEDGDGLDGLDYRRQGNKKFYDSEALELRRRCRVDERVVNAINGMWGRFNVLDDVKQTMTCEEYCAMNCGLQLALANPDADDDELIRVSGEDWFSDADKGYLIDRTMFFEAIFEFMDIWCDSVDPAHYAQFLKDAIELLEETIAQNRARIMAAAKKSTEKLLNGDFGELTAGIYMDSDGNFYDRLGRRIFRGADGRWYDADGNLLYDENMRPVVYSNLGKDGNELVTDRVVGHLIRTASGRLVDEFGNVYDEYGNLICDKFGYKYGEGFTCGADGTIRDKYGRILVRGADGNWYDENGNLMYYADGTAVPYSHRHDGTGFDKDGTKFLALVDAANLAGFLVGEDGHIRDKYGRILIRGADGNWYDENGNLLYYADGTDANGANDANDANGANGANDANDANTKLKFGDLNFGMSEFDELHKPKHQNILDKKSGENGQLSALSIQDFDLEGAMETERPHELLPVEVEIMSSVVQANKTRHKKSGNKAMAMSSAHAGGKYEPPAIPIPLGGRNAANAAGGKYEPPPIPIPLSNRATIEGGDSAAATAEHVPKPPTEAAPKSKRPGKASGRQEKTRDAVGKPNVAEHQRVKKPAKGRPAALPRRQANAIVSSQPGASQPAEEAGFMVGMGGASQAPMASPVLPSIGKSVERGGGSEKERNFSPTSKATSSMSAPSSRPIHPPRRKPGVLTETNKPSAANRKVAKSSANKPVAGKASAPKPIIDEPSKASAPKPIIDEPSKPPEAIQFDKGSGLVEMDYDDLMKASAPVSKIHNAKPPPKMQQADTSVDASAKYEPPPVEIPITSQKSQELTPSLTNTPRKAGAIAKKSAAASVSKPRKEVDGLPLIVSQQKQDEDEEDDVPNRRSKSRTAQSRKGKRAAAKTIKRTLSRRGGKSRRDDDDHLPAIEVPLRKWAPMAYVVANVQGSFVLPPISAPA